MKKLFVTILFLAAVCSRAQILDASLTLEPDKAKDVIDKNIYGQFSEHLGHCIYGGIWVGENSSVPNIKGYRKDVLEALQALQIPNLRWPGGCFADEYHWTDGIGPKDKRPKMVNTNWGGVTEDNSFGTHEFLDFCELIGCEPYISANLGSGTVEEMSKWVEYMTFDGDSPMSDLRRKNGRDKPWRVKFLGIGNESWGCGGNMTPDFYADQFRRYGTYTHNYGRNRLYKIASGASDADYRWTETLMQKAAPVMDGISLHFYTCKTWQGSKGSATGFSKNDYLWTITKCQQLDELVAGHIAIMDKYDPDGRIGLMVDEWGTWWDVEPGTNPGFLFQQNTMRDALVAATSLNIMNNHCNRVRMSNIAQIINVLQSLILTRDDKMVLTPTYYVYQLYKPHKDAVMIPFSLQAPALTYESKSFPAVNTSASRDRNGKIHLSLVNTDPDHIVALNCNPGISLSKVLISAEILASPGMADHNTFEQPDKVKPARFTDYTISQSSLIVRLSARSVVVLEISAL
jgi:alpha-N-arabinofuranosidase